MPLWIEFTPAVLLCFLSTHRLPRPVNSFALTTRSMLFSTRFSQSYVGSPRRGEACGADRGADSRGGRPETSTDGGRGASVRGLVSLPATYGIVRQNGGVYSKGCLLLLNVTVLSVFIREIAFRLLLFSFYEGPTAEFATADACCSLLVFGGAPWSTKGGG